MSTRKQRRRDVLRARAGFACAYCRITENLMGGRLTEDHIIPPGQGGTDDIDNLCWCCWWCNTYKGTQTAAPDPHTGNVVPLFNPRQERWEEHFRWSRDGTRYCRITRYE
ncbi:MAG: HNH endonuclease [Abditibacteriales bacterium]|nr:HNH endonuclease [Abditibacteriales bacterium]MDW8366445.1 HNH endonuclease [Abditibacteriales bacterium]